MTLLTFTTLWVSSTGLALSIGASFVALRSLRRFQLSSAGRLSERLTELESTVEALSGQIRNIRSARNMAAHRARKSQPEADAAAGAPETVDDDARERERAEMNNLVATGANPFRIP